MAVLYTWSGLWHPYSPRSAMWQSYNLGQACGSPIGYSSRSELWQFYSPGHNCISPIPFQHCGSPIVQSQGCGSPIDSPLVSTTEPVL